MYSADSTLFKSASALWLKWCVVVLCGVIWCGVVWFDVLWCGVACVVWCGVVIFVVAMVWWCGDKIWCIVSCHGVMMFRDVAPCTLLNAIKQSSK